jgi:hypothetical protein
MYFWISVSEDGDIRIEKMKREQVVEAINVLANEHEGQLNFLTDITDNDPMYWPNKGTINLLIKGNIVEPKPIQLVTKYEL